MTDLNQPAKWFEITATPEQLEQGRHHWKINYQHIAAIPYIQTAAPFPTPQNLTEAAHHFNHPGPFYLTVHPTQHGEALLALCQLAYEGHQIHLYLTDHQKPGQWHLSTEPLPGTRPAPRYDSDDDE